MKCEVLCDTVISVCKGSIVEVTEKQYELARNVLKPVDMEQTYAPIVEKRAKSKTKK